jgi:hypothetical protein
MATEEFLLPLRYKTAFGRTRTDQGPQLTHYIRQLMGFRWILI